MVALPPPPQQHQQQQQQPPAAAAAPQRPGAAPQPGEVVPRERDAIL
jgi:hypothetical protein